MLYGVLLLWLAVHVIFGPTIAYIFLGLLLLRFVSYMLTRTLSRIPTLTRTKPTIPIGKKRVVSLQPDAPLLYGDGSQATREDFSCLDNFQVNYYLFMSIIIVPYESVVVFVDSKIDKTGRENFTLSFQEKQHSFVHSIYNRFYFSRSTNPNLPPFVERLLSLCYSIAWFAIPRVNKLLPDVVSGMIALLENGFFYRDLTANFFVKFNPHQNFQKCPLLAKILLWHMAEEREHCEESTYLFNQLYGLSSIPLLLLGMPLMALTLDLPSLLALILKIHSNPKSIITAFIEFIDNVIDNDSLIMLSLILLSAGLNTKDEFVQKEMTDFRSKFRDLFGQDLNTERLRIN